MAPDIRYMTGRNKSALPRTALFVIVLLLFVGPRLELLDFHVATVLSAGALGILVFSLRRRLPRWLTIVCVALIPALIYATFVGAIRDVGTLELSYLIVRLYIYAIAIAWLIYVYSACYPQGWSRFLLKHVVVAWLIVSIGAIAFIVSEDYRTFIASYWFLAGNEHWAEIGYRAYDFVSGGGFNGAFGYAVFVLLLLHVRKRVPLPGFIVAVTISSCAVAGLFMARSFLPLLLTGLGVSLLLKLGRRPGMISLPHFFFSLAVRGLMLLIFSLFLGAVFLAVDPQARAWAFEFLAQGGTLQLPRSGRHIAESMFFLPDSASGLLFGEGYLGRAEAGPLLASDVGYVRVIFSAGMIGSLLVWGPFLALLVYGTLAYSHRGLESGRVASALAAMILVGNVKELLFFPRVAGLLSLLVIALFLIEAGGRRLSLFDR